MNKSEKRRYLRLFVKWNALGITKDELKQMQSLFGDSSLVTFLQWLKQQNWLGVKNSKLYLNNEACESIKKLWPEITINQFASVKAVEVKDEFDFPVDFKSEAKDNGQIAVQVNYLSDQSGRLTNKLSERLVVNDWRAAKDLSITTGISNHGFTRLEPRIDHQVKLNVNSLFS